MPTVIITGASSGIGAAIARELASAGYQLVLAARRLERLQALAEELGRDQVVPVQADVIRRGDMSTLVEQARDRFGGIDVLINNAGVMPLSFLSRLHVEEWERMVDVNIKGVLNGIAAVLPVMREQKSGHIVNMSSIAGLSVFPAGAVYCATKFAVEALSQGLRQELSQRDNIRVTAIRPGATKSELTDSITDPTIVEWFESRQQDMRFLEAEDIARAVLYALQQPDYVNVNEITVRPVDQG